MLAMEGSPRPYPDAHALASCGAEGELFYCSQIDLELPSGQYISCIVTAHFIKHLPKRIEGSLGQTKGAAAASGLQVAMSLSQRSTERTLLSARHGTARQRAHVQGSLIPVHAQHAQSRALAIAEAF
jgi:hypothetical protein